MAPEIRGGPSWRPSASACASLDTAVRGTPRPPLLAEQLDRLDDAATTPTTMTSPQRIICIRADLGVETFELRGGHLGRGGCLARGSLGRIHDPEPREPTIEPRVGGLVCTASRAIRDSASSVGTPSGSVFADGGRLTCVLSAPSVHPKQSPWRGSTRSRRGPRGAPELAVLHRMLPAGCIVPCATRAGVASGPATLARPRRSAASLSDLREPQPVRGSAGLRNRPEPSALILLPGR